jgi:hypothetical protein
VTISTTTSGASIRYTTDGSTPSEVVGTLYSGAITVSATTIINAIAYASGFTDSPVTTGTFAISPWYNVSWSNRKAITIDHTKVSGSSSLTNFPVLISLPNDTDLEAVAQANGNDILFTAADGTTKLSHEIEQYTASTGQLIAWVQVPTVSPTGDTLIYIYYGNASAADQQNQTGVWDSGFKLVQHLEQTSGVTTYDSTSNGNNGTKVSATSPTATSAGEIGGAQSFDGSGDYIFNPGFDRGRLGLRSRAGIRPCIQRAGRESDPRIPLPGLPSGPVNRGGCCCGRNFVFRFG